MTATTVAPPDTSGTYTAPQSVPNSTTSEPVAEPTEPTPDTTEPEQQPCAAPSDGAPTTTAAGAAATTGAPIALPDTTDPCSPPTDCPTPTYAAGFGSYDGSGGGLASTHVGRTHSWPPTDNATIAGAIGLTLTGMDYSASAGDATGAYLIDRADWAGFRGYPDAASAPTGIQDERAAQLVERLRTQIGGDYGPAAIALVWHANVTTTDLFADDFVYYVHANLDPDAGAAVSAVRPTLAAGEVAFPVLGPVSYGDTFGAPRGGVPGDEQPRCHEGTDLFGAHGQPILAPVSGVVRIGVGDPALSGIALSVTGGGGNRYNLAHLSAIAPGIVTGTQVSAGQIIGYMGATGNGGVPHLHFEIRDLAGNPVPSFAALDAAARRQHGQIGIGPWSATVLGTATSHLVVTTTTGNGMWIIDNAGRVTATGDAALLAPTGQPGPDIPYGTDAAG